MKLALIRRHFSETGGAELYLQRLLGALADSGHDLHLFTEVWGEAPAAVTVHALPGAGRRAEGPIRFADAVQRELAGRQFDCVFSLDRTRRQDVYRAGDGVHRVWLERRRQFALVLKRPFVGLGAFHRNLLRLEAEAFDPRNTRRIIVNSEMVRREVLAHFSFPAERIHLVRNGVDVARFQGGNRENTRARFGVKEDDFLLLFVGSGWERKGLRYLLSALRHLQIEKSWRVLAEGVRGFRQATREIAAALQGASGEPPKTVESSSYLPVEKVKLLVVGRGRRPVDVPSNVILAKPMADIENAYAAADLFVFLPVYEPSANVVFEALAAGLPVVTSAQNGAGEMIEEKVNGTVVEDPTDTAGVVDAIAYWWTRRFYAPPVHAAELSLDRNVEETLAILELAAREKAG